MSTRTRNVFLVMRREFLERVRKKSFIIMTILTPVLVLAVVLGPQLLFMKKAEKTTNIVVKDETGWMAKGLIESTASGDKGGKYSMNGRFSKAPQGATLESLKKRLSDGDKSIDGVLDIKKVPDGELKIVLFARNLGNIKLAGFIERNVNNVYKKHELDSLGVSEAVRDVFKRNLDIESVKVEKGGIARKASFLIDYMKAMMFSLILYMLILTYGIALMRGVMEEKNGKIAEVLLSALRPFELLMGKVIGIASVGLLQYAIWFLMGLALVLANPMGFMEVAGSAMIGFGDLALLALLFLLGFFFYASIYSAIGAVCTTDQEAQQMQLPVILCLAMPMMLLVVLIQDPNATWVSVLSMLPLFAPTLMPMRFSLISVPGWQLAVSIAGLVVGTVIMSWIGGKIFSVGILMTGKKPSIPEILRWIRAA